MNYNKIVQGILDIGESMLISGAENYRIEDSLYRMCRSYGFVKYDVFVIPSNIQITVETENGDIITQVRHIENADIDFDQLDYMNNLCRYICSHTWPPNMPPEPKTHSSATASGSQVFCRRYGRNRICGFLWM